MVTSTIANCIVSINVSPIITGTVNVKAQFLMLEASREISQAVTGETANAATALVEAATLVLQAAGDRAISQIKAEISASVDRLGIGASPKVDIAASLVQQVAPTVLVFAKVCLETLPRAAKGGKKKKAAEEDKDVATFREAIHAIINVVGLTSQSLSKEIEALSKIPFVCSQEDASGPHALQLKQLTKIMGLSQQSSYKQLQGSAKQIIDLAVGIRESTVPPFPRAGTSSFIRSHTM